MHHLVDDDVFQAFARLFCEVRIEADAGGAAAAAAPFRFHSLDEEAVHVDAHEGFPFCDQRGRCFFELCAVPLFEYGLFRAGGADLASAQGEDAEGWVYRTAVRIALNELRRQTLRSRYERLLGFVMYGKAGGSTPHEIYAAQEEQQRVRLVLSVIEPRQAELLLLRCNDLSYQELASTLNLNPASIGTLLSRALQAFRKEFIQRYGKDRYGHE